MEKIERFIFLNQNLREIIIQLKRDLFIQKIKFMENISILKIPEKKLEFFINLKSLHFPSTAASVLKTRITQNLQNSLQIDS